jgi:hypothetical protein
VRDGSAQQFDLFGILQRAILTYGSQQNESIDAAFDQSIETPQRREYVVFAGIVELGSGRGENALPVRFHACASPLV